MRYNEWHPEGLTPVKGTYTATKLKNRLLKIDPTLVCSLKNAKVNGMVMGCTGFVSSADGSVHVYVNTDHNHGTSMDNAYYRLAKDTRDYTGGMNHSANYTDLAGEVVDLLHKTLTRKNEVSA